MYGYNRSSCYSCGPCNNRNYSRCDCCTAQCCLDNMSSHREIFDLNDNLKNTIQYAIKDVCNKCNEIKYNLNKYNIMNIYSNCYNINDCQNFLNKMREKNNTIKESILINENLLSNLSKTNKKCLDLLRKEHEEKLEQLKNKFIENTKDYKKNNTAQEKKLNEKKKEKKQLENIKDGIDIDKELILNNYDKEERKKAEFEFKNNINDIEKKYMYTEEKLVYTENELESIKQYKNDIQKIKKYSNNPLYNNFIISFGLNKYIN